MTPQFAIRAIRGLEISIPPLFSRREPFRIRLILRQTEAKTLVIHLTTIRNLRVTVSRTIDALHNRPCIAEAVRCFAVGTAVRPACDAVECRVVVRGRATHRIDEDAVSVYRRIVGVDVYRRFVSTVCFPAEGRRPIMHAPHHVVEAPAVRSFRSQHDVL